jgi:lipopolysaccharide/colanic/teichoic acid biosynthesis glycosyltransferase
MLIRGINVQNSILKEQMEHREVYEFLKRSIDILCSLIGLLVLMPILVIVAILIRIESKGSIIFSQDRVGKNGMVFKMYKFRSMVINAEELKEKLANENERTGPMFKIKDDPRITQIGRFIRKTSIDELPQLVNILKGQMTIVGPRPSLPDEVKEFKGWMLKRLNVKPGLTCYWQVSGRNDIEFNEWMELDIKYVKERNILIDVKLIIKTFIVLFGDSHAS